MLDEGADVNLARQLDGCTPLHAVLDTFHWVHSADASGSSNSNSHHFAGNGFMGGDYYSGAAS